MTPTFALLSAGALTWAFLEERPGYPRSFRLSCHRARTLHPDLGRRARLPGLAVRDRASDLLSGRIDERRGHHDLQSRRRNAGSSAATGDLALIPVSASLLACPCSRA